MSKTIKQHIAGLKKILTLNKYAFLIAGICSALAGYLVSKAVVFNADAISNIFMFQSGFSFHDFRLADWHTSILKFPILILQALFPLDINTFTVWVILTLLATILLWSHAVSLMLGRRFFAPTAIIMSLITLASLRFTIEISLITIRNLEFGIFLYLLILFWKLITQKKRASQKKYILSWALYAAGASLLFASDPYFIYAMIPAQLIAGVLYFYQKKIRLQTLAALTLITLAPALLSKLLLIFLKTIGVYSYAGSSLSPPLYQFEQLGASLWQAIHDLMLLFNANFFGMNIGPGLLVSLILFGLLLISLGAFFKSFRNIAALAAAKPVYATLLISAGIMFTIYILTFSLSRSFRYISLLVFILPVLFLVFFDTFKYPAFLSKKHISTTALVAAFLIIPILYLQTVKQYTALDFFDYRDNKATIQGLTKTLTAHGVDGVIAEHNYAAPIHFWSQSTIKSIPTTQCKDRLPFLVRSSWYDQAHYSKVALIVDPKEHNSALPTSECNLDTLIKRFGEPIETFTTTGYKGAPLDGYVFNPEVISAIKNN